MPIKNLTTPRTAVQTPDGKPIRLGYIGKGEREGFGTNIKLHDRDYFVFTPVASGAQGERLRELFALAYGQQPTELDPVHIPISLAGNFNIEDAAWLTSSKHTERGSTFLAQSDGDTVKRYRDEKDGRVRFYHDGELLHRDVTVNDGTEYGSVRYRDKLYPWQQSLSIDLVLPTFNDLVYANGVAGHGVVTLMTHSKYDITGLIAEYYGLLNEVASLFANPFQPGDIERVKNYIPLRQIPLRLYRSVDKITTPNWKTKDAGDRLNSTRSLLHWQLNAQFSSAAQKAMNQRTDLTIAAIANMPLLGAGNGRITATDDQLNDALFGDGNTPVKIAPRSVGVDWDAMFNGPDEPETEEGEYTESPPKPDIRGQESPDAQASRDPRKIANGNGKPAAAPAPTAGNWKDKTLAAKSLVTFCSAAAHALPQYGNEQYIRQVLDGKPGFTYSPDNNAEIFDWLAARDTWSPADNSE